MSDEPLCLTDSDRIELIRRIDNYIDDEQAAEKDYRNFARILKSKFKRGTPACDAITQMMKERTEGISRDELGHAEFWNRVKQFVNELPNCR